MLPPGLGEVGNKLRELESMWTDAATGDDAGRVNRGARGDSLDRGEMTFSTLTGNRDIKAGIRGQEHCGAEKGKRGCCPEKELQILKEAGYYMHIYYIKSLPIVWQDPQELTGS